MKLEQIPKRKNRKNPSKRLGRGYGSGVGGHTVGRGQKGQKSRSGHKSMSLFEGGQRPFYKKTPKYRGFKRHNKITYKVVNIMDIENNFEDGDKVSLESLREKGLINKKEKNVKILGYGDLTKKIVLEESLSISEKAKEKLGNI